MVAIPRSSRSFFSLQADVLHVSNLSRAAFSSDRRSDTAANLGIMAFDFNRAAFTDHPWSFYFSLDAHTQSWRQFTGLDNTNLQARLTIERKLGSATDAPSLNFQASGGVELVRTTMLGGWRSQAGITLDQPITPKIFGSLFLNFYRLDARDEFFSDTGRELGAGLMIISGPRSRFSLTGVQHWGDELTYADVSRATTTPFSTRPSRPVALFDRPFDAYRADVKERSIGLDFYSVLARGTTLYLGIHHGVTWWDGLHYPSTSFAVGLVFDR